MLVAERAHPGAALLARPRIVVAVEQADMLAVRPAHLPGPHVRMPDRPIDGREGQPAQPLRAEDRRLDLAVELQIRLSLRLLEVARALAKLFRVVAPIPSGKLEV